jgi:pimeloyl-ACP methyl ester carboxylesterase/DNA-binding winged helix-turn-helix (wHTH) protein
MALILDGATVLDEEVYELRRGDATIPMEPQAFDVLVHLVRNRDRVVPKEELMDAVWGGRFVSETAVTSRIKQVRRALGDNGQEQRAVRTVHGRGYRFVAPVAEGVEAPTAADSPRAPGDDGPVVPAGLAAPVRYTVSDGLHIAYQVTGGGPLDIVLISGFVSHLDLDWGDPRHAYFLDRLGSMGRLIRFDKRGTGMSDRPSGVPDLETRMHDVLAVMDAAGSRQAVLFGYSEGGPMASLLAAMHPDRVEALILYGSYAKRERADDYPWAPTREERRQYVERLAVEWSWEADMRRMAPSADEAMARWWGQRARAAATPSTVRALIAMNTLVDVRDALGSIHAPTLVMHRRGDQDSRVEEGRYMADRIPGATFAELPGADHFVALDADQILDRVADFLAGLRAEVTPETALGAVLAIRGATPELSASRLARTPSGTVVAVYDGPATAIRDALAAGRTDSRFGLHIAEIPRAGSVVDGPGVAVAEQLADRAETGQLLLSATVRDLVAGSGIALNPAADAYTPALPRPSPRS